ncbi:MAG: Gfo/Idh/MocA family oxidoreductase [Candidatus Nitrotoga sp.]
MTEINRLALIGVGHIAEYQLEALASSKRWTFVAASDPRVERKSILPPDVLFFGSTEQLLGSVSADIFLVATPNQSHYEIGQMVLARGANLLLEKPCCETQGELVELTRLANARNCIFAVALHARYALDLLWFRDHYGELGLRLSDITRFECNFYDPYIQDSSLRPGAASLGGSWFDSGINALSVVGSLIPPDIISVTGARFTMADINGCSDSQSKVDFVYSLESGLGTGTIETSWTLGVNSKTTKLIFGRQGQEVLLDHTNEKVIVSQQGKFTRTIDLRTGRPRLVNHYVGVLDDVHDMYRKRETNLRYAAAIHRLLFDAASFAHKQG